LIPPANQAITLGWTARWTTRDEPRRHRGDECIHARLSHKYGRRVHGCGGLTTGGRSSTSDGRLWKGRLEKAPKYGAFSSRLPGSHRSRHTRSASIVTRSQPKFFLRQPHAKGIAPCRRRVPLMRLSLHRHRATRSRPSARGVLPPFRATQGADARGRAKAGPRDAAESSQEEKSAAPGSARPRVLPFRGSRCLRLVKVASAVNPIRQRGLAHDPARLSGRRRRAVLADGDACDTIRGGLARLQEHLKRQYGAAHEESGAHPERDSRAAKTGPTPGQSTPEAQ
jgi:hypothetical protein